MLLTVHMLQHINHLNNEQWIQILWIS